MTDTLDAITRPTGVAGAANAAASSTAASSTSSTAATRRTANAETSHALSRQEVAPVADYPGSDVKLRFESEGAWPVEIELGWDGDDLVVWIFMDTDDADTDAEFGIGGFQLTGVNVRARANFQLTEAQATELRDALTKLLVPVQACD